jgi:myo-inositol-hexaphosphate 3-phosphohydrolase
MANIYVEAKGPKGGQFKESLLPTAVSGYERGLAVVYGADAYHATLAGAAAAAIGIMEEDALNVANPTAVVEFGQVVAQIGANVAAGQSLAVNAAGQLVPAVATNPIVAVALEAQVYVAPGSFANVFVLGFFGTVIHP